MIKLILGGFPCTQFSLAQKKNRINKVDFTAYEFVEFHNNNKLWYQHIGDFEKYIGDKLGVENYKFAEGLQLFFNCIAAIDRTIEQYPNDKVYYMFENVSSMQKEIKETLTEILNRLYGGVSTEINSALVSAQNRKRIYFTNYGEIPQPEDKGILLKDILESGIAFKDKQNTIDANYFKGGNFTNMKKQSGQRLACAEPVGIGYRGRINNGKYAKQYESNTEEKANALTTAQTDSMVALPIRVGEIGKGGQGNRIYSTDGKSVSQTATGGGLGSKTGLYAIPIESKTVSEAIPKIVEKYGYLPEMFNAYNKSEILDKAPTLSTGSMVTSSCAVNKLEPICTAIYAIPSEWDVNGNPIKAISVADGKTYTVYEVKDGHITIKGRTYPIKLPDGFYIIRKLTVLECMRLQTVPEWYDFPVSDTQAYKMLGNGWTKDVISHILSFIPNIQNEEIDVLSLYDGMSCGKLALMDLGCEENINTYRAYEIDPYAIKTTQHNFPNTIQCGDAFKVRDDDWQA